MRRRRRVERGTWPHERRANVRFDRRAAEALALELGMLAKTHGLKVERIEIAAPRRRTRA